MFLIPPPQKKSTFQPHHQRSRELTRLKNLLKPLNPKIIWKSETVLGPEKAMGDGKS